MSSLYLILIEPKTPSHSCQPPNQPYWPIWFVPKPTTPSPLHLWYNHRPSTPYYYTYYFILPLFEDQKNIFFNTFLQCTRPYKQQQKLKKVTLQLTLTCLFPLVKHYWNSNHLVLLFTLFIIASTFGKKFNECCSF